MSYFATEAGDTCPTCRTSATEEDILLSYGMAIKCVKCSDDICLNCVIYCGTFDALNECGTTWCPSCADRCTMCKRGAPCHNHPTKNDICHLCCEPCPRCYMAPAKKVKFPDVPGFRCSFCKTLIPV